MRAPNPLGRNSFIFMQQKYYQIIGWLTPLGLVHPFWEILDPSLQTVYPEIFLQI